jgi:hypothetical protein
MTDEDQKELESKLADLRKLQGVTASRQRNAEWDIAWAEAVKCANRLLLVESKT